MKNLIHVVLILLMSSCIIRVNENYYLNLQDTDQQKVVSYSEVAIDTQVNNQDNVILYEITANNVLDYVKKNDFVWVHVWDPNCTTSECVNIKNFENAEVNHKDKNLKLIFVSESYSIERIEEIASAAHFEKSIQVLKDAHYGHNRLKGKRQFASELSGRKVEKDDRLNLNFVFVNGKLVEESPVLKPSVLDSMANSISN